jgi:hypothetical protein
MLSRSWQSSCPPPTCAEAGSDNFVNRMARILQHILKKVIPFQHFIGFAGVISRNIQIPEFERIEVKHDINSLFHRLP